MATHRMLIFAPGETYHVFNRGVERRPIFTDRREFERAIELIRYYRFAKIPMRYSTLNKLPEAIRQSIWQRLEKEARYEVGIIAYCLMPNHFHLLLRQVTNQGISRFIANISNGYTKFFNTRHKRVGPLLQGTFKAVRAETDEQLLHLTRYIHLNPATSFLVQTDELEQYQWSSLPEYFKNIKNGFCETSFVDFHFKSVDQHRAFVYDQAAYAQELEKIKHLMFDEQ